MQLTAIVEVCLFRTLNYSESRVSRMGSTNSQNGPLKVKEGGDLILPTSDSQAYVFYLLGKQHHIKVIYLECALHYGAFRRTGRVFQAEKRVGVRKEGSMSMVTIGKDQHEYR